MKQRNAFICHTFLRQNNKLVFRGSAVRLVTWWAGQWRDMLKSEPGFCEVQTNTNSNIKVRSSLAIFFVEARHTKIMIDTRKNDLIGLFEYRTLQWYEYRTYIPCDPDAVATISQITQFFLLLYVINCYFFVNQPYRQSVRVLWYNPSLLVLIVFWSTAVQCYVEAPKTAINADYFGERLLLLYK